MLDSAVEKGQEFTVDLLWFRFSTVSVLCSPEPSSVYYSLLSLLFFVLLPDLRQVSSYTLISCFYMIHFLFFFFLFAHMFLSLTEGEVQYPRYEARDPHVSRVQHSRTKRTSAVPTCPRKAGRRPR